MAKRLAHGVGSPSVSSHGYTRPWSPCDESKIRCFRLGAVVLPSLLHTCTWLFPKSISMSPSMSKRWEWQAGGGVAPKSVPPGPRLCTWLSIWVPEGGCEWAPLWADFCAPGNASLCYARSLGFSVRRTRFRFSGSAFYYLAVWLSPPAPWPLYLLHGNNGNTLQHPCLQRYWTRMCSGGWERLSPYRGDNDDHPEHGDAAWGSVCHAGQSWCRQEGGCVGCVHSSEMGGPSPRTHLLWMEAIPRPGDYVQGFSLELPSGGLAWPSPLTRGKKRGLEDPTLVGVPCFGPSLSDQEGCAVRNRPLVSPQRRWAFEELCVSLRVDPWPKTFLSRAGPPHPVFYLTFPLLCLWSEGEQLLLGLGLGWQAGGRRGGPCLCFGFKSVCFINTKGKGSGGRCFQNLGLRILKLKLPAASASVR